MNPPQDNRDNSARSPFAGCAILIIAVAVILFLIVFSVITLFRQGAEIAKFTGDKPATLDVTPLDNKEARINSLAERIERFRQQLGDNTQTSLDLSPEEINLAIAAYEPLAELRGKFRVEDIRDGKMRVAISFPLNGMPRFTRPGEAGWFASDARFLNATLVSRPALHQKEIVLRIDQIEVPGATVPREFIDQMSPYRITERYLVDPVIGPAMAKLTRLELADGKLVLTRTPGEVAPETITNAQVDSGRNRLFKALGVAACMFLACVAVIVLVGVRSRSRKQRGL
jgi:hypothetical protein